MIKWDLSQGCKDFSISAISVIYHIRLKNKNHMIISIDGEKAVDKIQHSFLIKKIFQKVGTEGIYFNIIKVINDKLTGNIIVSGENLKTFP